MIRFFHHDSIDKARWDYCINRAVNGNLNACSWHLDIVSPGWCALIEDDYEIVFPLPVSSKGGFEYIMQPYFTQQLGLFYPSGISEEKTAQFLASIPPKYKIIDINLNTSNHISSVETITDNTNLELDLNCEYAKIAAGYKNNLVRNLAKAAQSKLTIAKHVSPEEIIQLFKSNKGQELKHLGDKQYIMIQQIACESINRGMGEIWGACDEHNQLVAAILWVTSHQKAIFLFSALSARGKSLNAMPWLIDAYIRQNCPKPLTLDFEGSNNEGLARFYSSFGANRVVYQRFFRNTLPLPLRSVLKTWRKIRHKLQNWQ
ncbi:MAG: hypothetical protein WCI92_07180 [Bacteroidota bacterium]